MATFAENLRASPALYPLAINPRVDAVQLIQLSEEDYGRASFLDANASTWLPQRLDALDRIAPSRFHAFRKVPLHIPHFPCRFDAALAIARCVPVFFLSA